MVSGKQCSRTIMGLDCSDKKTITLLTRTRRGPSQPTRAGRTRRSVKLGTVASRLRSSAVARFTLTRP